MTTAEHTGTNAAGIIALSRAGAIAHGGRMASFSQREGPDAPWEPYDLLFSAQIAAAIGSSPAAGHIWCPFAGGDMFQLRWGSEACSSKMAAPPPSGMVQVNVKNENTRVARRDGPTELAAPWIAAGGGTLPDVPIACLTPAVATVVDGDEAVSFSQQAGPDAPWEPYDPIFCEQIAAAIGHSPAGGRIWCQAIADGQTFQIRWGAQAHSRKMPHAPPSGMLQCNVLTQNTRLVKRNGPAKTDPASPWRALAAAGSAVCSAVAKGQLCPAGWKTMQTADGKTYYVNHSDNTSHWLPPQASGQASAAQSASGPDTIKSGGPMLTPLKLDSDPAALQPMMSRVPRLCLLADHPHPSPCAIAANADMLADIEQIVDETERKKLRSRNRVLAEMIDTEKSYGLKLDTIHELYAVPLRDRTDLLDQNAWNTVFRYSFPLQACVPHGRRQVSYKMAVDAMMPFPMLCAGTWKACGVCSKLFKRPCSPSGKSS